MTARSHAALTNEAAVHTDCRDERLSTVMQTFPHVSAFMMDSGLRGQK